MIQKINIGEIVNIGNREYLIKLKAIGCTDKKAVDIVLLDNQLKAIYRDDRKNRLRKKVKEIKAKNPNFKLIKCVTIKGS